MNAANAGLTDSTVAQIQAVLRQFPSVEKAVLYGSRAKGNYKRGSDIDLTLFGPDLDWTTVGKISSDLEDSTLPYMFDLSIFDKLEHEPLKEHIRRVGVTFYQRTPE